MLGCIQPMSSPMMNRMFGLAGGAWADARGAVVVAPKTMPVSKANDLGITASLRFMVSFFPRATIGHFTTLNLYDFGDATGTGRARVLLFADDSVVSSRSRLHRHWMAKSRLRTRGYADLDAGRLLR